MPPRVIVAVGSVPLREMIRQSLVRSGCEAVCPPAEAMGQLLQQAPGARCLILDAETAWRATLDLVRSTWSGESLPVVLVAERPTRALVIDAARAGIGDVIVKSPDVGAVVLRRLAKLGLGGPGPHPAAPPGPNGAPAAPPTPGPGPGPSHEEALEELGACKPLLTRTHLLDLVDQRATLRALPPVARQVLTLAGSATTSLEEIARVVKQDPAICVKILRLANSSAYAAGPRVDSVQKAVSRIGLSQIREAVMNLEILDQFSGVRCGRIRADWFWEHSIAVGLIASRLARRAGAGPESAEAMFTAGLLHDLGRMLLTEVLPDQYIAVIQTAERLGLPLEVVESRLLMVNHAELTDRVLRGWKFPPELINPITFHHLTMAEGRHAVPRMAESVAILGLANRLAHALLIGSSGNEVVYPLREHMRGLAVDPALADELCDQVPSETSEMRMVLMARTADTDTTSFDQHLRKRLDRAGPVASVSGAAGLDPFDLVVARLWGPAPGSPRAAIAYVHNPHEAEAAAARLKDLDAQAGRRLPAVVVSPTGTVSLPPAEPRPVRHLPCPTTVARLCRALEALADATPAADAA